MKLIYFANIRIPTERAHGIQIMKTCEAFARNGAEVTLVAPARTNRFKNDPFAYYRLEKNFKIKKLPCLDLVFLGSIGFKIETLTFAASVAIFAFFQTGAVLFTRDEAVAFATALVGKKICWEAHQGKNNFITRFLIKKKVKIVAISHGLKNFYLKLGAREENILVAPDGVDLAEFNLNISKIDARVKLGLSREKKIILYTGHLYDWKGADVLAEAAGGLGKDKEVIFVGGADEDIALFKKKFGWFSNIKILGRRPHAEIPLYLKAADVLVLPNSGREDISRFYTSPMKLFEYMASGRPIVASDLPSIREVLNEKNAVFSEPDNPVKLRDAIELALRDKELTQRIADRALLDAGEYDWRIRARKVLDFLST